MLRIAPFIIIALFVIIQILYYLGVFKNLKNKFIPMFLFLGLSGLTLLIAYII